MRAALSKDTLESWMLVHPRRRCKLEYFFQQVSQAQDRGASLISKR
jgi:hypothetical protein